MDQAKTPSPNKIPWPPIIFGLAILAAWLLGKTYSVQIFPIIFTDLPAALGVLLLVGGLLIDFLTIRELSKHKTTVLPHKGAERLVTSGPFAVSRNPIYVGNTMLTFGLGLIFNNFWFLPAAFIAAFLVQKLAIEREEAHLKSKFGKMWSDYAKNVRRWV